MELLSFQTRYTYNTQFVRALTDNCFFRNSRGWNTTLGSMPSKILDFIHTQFKDNAKYPPGYLLFPMFENTLFDLSPSI